MRCSRNNWKVVLLKKIDFIHVRSPHTFNIHVMHQRWIQTICGLPCASCGSMLCSTIHGLSVQSVDPRFVQHRVRRLKLKGKDAIAEKDCDRLCKALLGICIWLGILHCSLWGLG